MELTLKNILALFFVGVIVYGLWQSGALNQLTGGQSVGQWFLQPTEQPQQPQTQPQTKPAETEVATCPTAGQTAPDLKFKIVDAMNPKQGISGIRVEAIPTDENPWDPYRTVLDYTDTDGDGVATLSGGALKIGKEYKFVIRGDNTIYDKVFDLKVPCISGDFAGKPWMFDKPISVYRVGEFDDLNTTGDNVLDCTDDPTLNVTAHTGVQQVSFTINVGMPEDAAGKALKDPVIVFRSPEGYELEDGDILHIYAIKASGSELGIPAGDLQGYLSGGTPIALTTKTQVKDGNAVHYIMTSADAATYKIIIQYDADNIDPDDDKLQIVLDDLGDYNGKDVATRSTKAPAKTYTVEWCK